MNYQAIYEAACDNAERLVQYMFPAATKSGDEYKIGNFAGESGGSIDINVAKGGAWHEKNGKIGGTITQLWERHFGVDDLTAKKEIAGFLGINSIARPKVIDKVPGGWEPFLEVLRPDGYWDYCFPFYNEDGEVMFYKLRRNARDGKKKIFTVRVQWRGEIYKRMPDVLKKPGSVPLYGLKDLVDSFPLTPVLLFEGEKKVDAAKKRLPGYICVAISEGSSGVKKNDFKPLHGRDVFLWPDNDKVGHACMLSAASNIQGNVKIIVPPSGKPEKWDVCDAIEEGMDLESIIQAVEVYDSNVESKSSPVIEGFTDLEAGVPPGRRDQILSVIQDEFGVDDGAGHRIVPSRYIVMRRLAELDPDFEHLVKTDEATNMEVFSPVYKGSIDALYNAVLRRAELYGLEPSRQTRIDLISSLASEHKINSLGIFIESIMASGSKENCIDDLMKYIKLRDNTAKGREHVTKLMDLFFRNSALHLIRSFTSERFPNEICPIFVGEQRKGKSRLCRFLSIDRKKFIDMGDKADAPLGSKDCIRLIAGMFIGELGEMSFTERSTVNVTKSFISATEDRYTPKFKEGFLNVPRTISFIGTSNPGKYLKDTTGNRRFWPIEIDDVDFELFNHHEIPVNLWSYYFDWAMSVENEEEIDEIFPTSHKEMHEYFDLIKRGAVDIGDHAEAIMGVIRDMEVWGKQDVAVRLQYEQVAAKYWGTDISKRPATYNRQISNAMMVMGYDIGKQVKYQGVNRKGGIISIRDIDARRMAEEASYQADERTIDVKIHGDEIPF